MSTTGESGVTHWHLDDIDWTEVQRQHNADGTVSVVREKWPIIRPGFLSAHVHYEPGMIVRRHGHRSNHVVFVLDGGAWIGGDWCGPDTHIHVPLGATFGPIVAGPDGVTCWELSFGEFGGWGDEPELYEREIRERGVTPLPDPPLDIGDWFVDPRGDWGGDRGTPRVPGLDEVVVRLADLPSTETAEGVREVRPIDEPTFSSTYVVCTAGASTVRGRAGHRLLWIRAGGARIDDRWCPAGTHVEFPVGVASPRIVAGDDGVEFLELVDSPPSV